MMYVLLQGSQPSATRRDKEGASRGRRGVVEPAGGGGSIQGYSGAHGPSESSARPVAPILGSPGDPAEIEAEYMAAEAITRFNRQSSDRTAVLACSGDHREGLFAGGGENDVARRVATGSGAARPAGLCMSAAFARQVRHARTHEGRPLAPELRAGMERSFAADFSDVRIHHSARAAELAMQARARAFALGRDVFFNHGAFRPHDPRGQQLIAHELAHVAQEGRSFGTMIRRSPLNGTKSEEAPFEPGDILTAKDFQDVVEGVRQVADDAVAMQIPGGHGEHLVVPLAAVEADPKTPTDEQHRAYVFRTTLDGELTSEASRWAARLEEARDRLKTALAARRIAESRKLVAAFGAIQVGAALGGGLGQWAFWGAGKLGTLTAGAVGGGAGGVLDGALTGGALTLIDGGTPREALGAAVSGAAWGVGTGAFLGGFGAVAAPWIRSRYYGGPKMAELVDEMAHVGVKLWKPPLVGRGVPVAREAVIKNLPIRKVAPDSLYRVDGAFRVYKGSKSIALQGYKMHVSATLDNAPEVAQVILSELQRLGVPHKVVKSWSEYQSMTILQEQVGKFITIYPRSVREASFLRNVLGRKLWVNRIHHPSRFFPIVKEASVDPSGGIYVRYGRQLVHRSELAGGAEPPIFRTNKLGQAINNEGKPVQYRGASVKITEPLNLTEDELGELVDLLRRQGVPEVDPRGTAIAPEWAEPLEL